MVVPAHARDRVRQYRRMAEAFRTRAASPDISETARWSYANLASAYDDLAAAVEAELPLDEDDPADASSDPARTAAK
jgi:hypothetical protein